MLTVRNADLPQRNDSNCQALAAILERELVNSSNISLLERKRLKTLLDERANAPQAKNTPLLASLFSLSLEFSRADNGDAIQMVATLSDGNGKSLRTFRTKSQDEYGAWVVTPLADSIRKYLKAAKLPQVVNAKLESQQFFTEAELLYSFRQPEESCVAPDTAIALDPNNVRAKQLLMEYLSLNVSKTFYSKRKTLKSSGRISRYGMSAKTAFLSVTRHMRALQLHYEVVKSYENRPIETIYKDVLTNRTLY